MPTKLEILQAIMRATREHDTEAFLSHLTDDVEYHYHVSSRPLLGKDWVRRFMDKYRSYTADVRGKVWSDLQMVMERLGLKPVKSAAERP